MKCALLALSMTMAATAPATAPAPEPPSITLTEKQRMVLVDTIAGLKEERDAAEARALYWFRKAKSCESRVQI